jgi:hypothetical protein
LAQAYPRRRHWAEILVDPLMREPKRRLKAAVITEQLRGAPPLRAAVVNQSPTQYSQHRNSNKQSRQRYAANGFALSPCVPSGAICSSARLLQPLHARDTLYASEMSSQDVLWLLPLLTLHNTWQHLQSFEDRERSQSREASS